MSDVVGNENGEAVLAGGGEEEQHTSKAMSRQEQLAMVAMKEKQDEAVEYCEHLLRMLTTNTDGPDMWREKEFKGIRECVQVIKAQPQQFPPLRGDNMPDGSSFSNEEGVVVNPRPLTVGYISGLAKFQELDEENPVLQVVSAKPKSHFETTTSGKKTGTTHFTHLRLRDGTNDVMTGRLSMHLAHDGRNLTFGDVIELGMFTPMTFKDSGEGKPYRSPGVIIHSFSKVRNSTVPRKLNTPIHCEPLADNESEDEVNNSTLAEALISGDNDGYEELVEVECTPENRYCAKYGFNPVLCICETDPVDTLDLEMVHELCWFADRKVEKMEPTLKRNMLFWWYMTNHYNICGKGNRKPPPDCLKAAIRMAYPEPSGRYKIFVYGNKTATAERKRSRK